jgi:hypothetical protein
LVGLLGAPLPGTACPVERTIAYSRDTTPGIPPGGRTEGALRRPISTTYLVYLVVAKGGPPAVSGVWIKGTYFTVTLRRVQTPVVAEHDGAVPTGESDVLVPATSSTVYELRPGDEQPWSAGSAEEESLTRDNELVVFLRVGRSTRYCPVKTIERLPPVAGQ